MQVSIGIDVNAAPIFERGARILTDAAQRAAGKRPMDSGPGIDEFQAFRAVLSTADTVKFQLCSIAWAERDAKLAQRCIVLAGIVTAVYGDNGSCKTKLT